MEDIDLNNRNPKHLNDFVSIEFNDVLAETDMLHIFDWYFYTYTVNTR